jgi:indolepyruvate ferredoxin oxidoreductase alpha subunit
MSHPTPISPSVLLSGDEAVARGAFEAGVKVATAYPGTPSTEILQALTACQEVYTEWAPNEKVALEVALGAALAGARAMAAMKHVGVNVAADPLVTASYVGVRGGLVLLSADDPGMFSSQNEQDNRHYARLAKIPMLEPSDSQEAKEFTALAFSLSEQFDTPVLVRITTRLAHSKTRVALGEREEREVAGFVKEPTKMVMVPANARRRHAVVEARMKKLAQWAEECELNRVEPGDPQLGVIVSGVAYAYVKEVAPAASVLKLGLTHPLPKDLIRRFAASVEKLYVVEDLDPFLEEQIRALGVVLATPPSEPRQGELSPRLVAAHLGLPVPPAAAPATDLPPRPPTLCPGCGHRALFAALKPLRVVYSSDIGCYTLGVQPPLQTIDTCVCMGASIGLALGIEKATGRADGTVAIIGDSTFIHSGITGLIDIVYNRGATTVIILDNETVAMTGHQDHPGTGKTAAGEPTTRLRLEELVKAVGVKDVTVIDPYLVKETRQVIKDALARPEPSVIIARRRCVLADRKMARVPRRVDVETCAQCGVCLNLGCPALTDLTPEGEKKKQVKIEAQLCAGCDVCARLCPSGAIQEVGSDA